MQAGAMPDTLTVFHYGACVNCRINFGVIRVKIRNSYSIRFNIVILLSI